MKVLLETGHNVYNQTITAAKAISGKQGTLRVLKQQSFEHVCDFIALVEDSLASVQIQLSFTQVKVIVEREKVNILSVAIAIFNKHATHL